MKVSTEKQARAAVNELEMQVTGGKHKHASSLNYNQLHHSHDHEDTHHDDGRFDTQRAFNPSGGA